MSKYRKQSRGALAQLLPNLISDRGWERQIDLHSIFPRWRELVGEEVGECSTPLKIDRGVLWLEVENSSWLQQLQYEKINILDTVNRSLRLSTLRDIKMVLPKGKDKSRKKTVGTEVRFVKPQGEKIEAFQQQVSCIEDEKCREALMQFWYLAQACQRGEK